MGFFTRISLVLVSLSVMINLSACDNSTNMDKQTNTAAQAISISQPQIRATAPGQKVSGAFMRLSNASSTPFALTAASFEASETVEIHETSMDGKMMRMMQVEQIDIPANGSVELKPGSYHIMLMGLSRQMKAGTTESITLMFSDNSQATIQASVGDLNQ